MWNIEAEIEEALGELNLPNADFIKCPKDQAEKIVKAAMNRYVEGNPRSWWLSLKKPHRSYDHDFPCDYIKDYVPNKESRCFWIPETEKMDLDVYECEINAIPKILRLTPPFEYYVIGKNLDWIIIETDHGLLWVIDETK